MAHIILFHHALGLTDGVHAFADALRSAGHEVTVPDLFAGQTFATVDEGVEHARSVGFDTVRSAGVAAAESLPSDIVYAGFSLGVMPAQQLAQTRPGARGALLYHAAVPVDEFGAQWPTGVPAQIHVMQDDDLGDVDVAQDLAAAVDEAELFLYPGSAHLFTDSTTDTYDDEATRLVLDRTLELLSRLG